jgi:hypothetical protein
MADRLVQQIWYSGTSKIRSASKFHLEIIFIRILESVPVVQWLWLCFDVSVILEGSKLAWIIFMRIIFKIF